MEVWILKAQTEDVLAIERKEDGLRVEVPITAARAIKHILETGYNTVQVPYIKEGNDGDNKEDTSL